MQNFLYKIFDFLKGFPVGKNLKNIAEINDCNTSEVASSQQKIQFEKLRNHAVSTTSFYKEFKNFLNIEEFPVINKNIINENRERFISSEFKISELKAVTTSGSTGIPFKVFHDKNKIERQIADNIYFSKLCGHKIGGKLYYIRVWNEINSLSPLLRKIKNIVQINTVNLDTHLVTELLLKLRNDKGEKSILSYSSSLEGIVQIIKRDKIQNSNNYNVNCVITMAEALSLESKEFLSNFLNTKIFSRYSNSENGFFAHQIPFLENNYLINKASFIVEILNLKNDLPMKNGEAGRIVITDLYNFAMPMIRYDTGDIGIIDYYSDKAGIKHEVLTSIEGRLLDFIEIDGRIISPHVVDYALRQIPNVSQFQLIQKKDFTFELLLNTFETYSKSQEEDIVNKLKVYLGESAEIKCNYVADIPRLASGKRKIVVKE